MRQLVYMGMCVLLLAACGNREDLNNERTAKQEVMSSQLKTGAFAKEKNPETRQKLVESVLKDTKFGDFVSVEGLDTKEPYSLEIEYKGKENLSEKMTIKSMQLTVRDAVYAIKELGLNIDNISVNVKYPFTDNYGNSFYRYVIKSNYSGSTVERLNADRKKFKEENLPIVADEWWSHPSFE
ncbi:hypothetical protein DVB69_10505 [Sporosarcina sp. BI001-red]|uniref:hypothetical protein n=1 Tax=Sporosarcina sp. BI001-red TaxID=2282866 RepID=UPI000E27501A|nr:hypothetical protein [Sporosarcina sp. BI001-red]REB07269.1 hypothetical protein DVB69_10505 [Sporosarcina sp. BI001-red]